MRSAAVHDFTILWDESINLGPKHSEEGAVFQLQVVQVLLTATAAY